MIMRTLVSGYLSPFPAKKYGLKFSPSTCNIWTYNWIRGGPKPLKRFALLVHQELRKVPLDRVNPKTAPFLRLQPLPEGMSIVPVHINFARHVPSDVELLGELLDFRLRPGLLTSKLIAGKPHDSQAFRPICRRRVFLIQGGQLFIVDLGLASP